MTPTDYYTTNYAMFLIQHNTRASVRELAEHLNRNKKPLQADGQWVAAYSANPNSLYGMLRRLCRFHANNGRPVEADAVAEAFTMDDGTYAYETAKEPADA